ncbi:MAG TPA: hypothetical protein VN181_04255 [Thermoanaerobaculia bacterium]|nr:hypothetical protein [Thermoanaerobaculia bacterium]
MNIPLLFLTSVLILQSGDRIDVAGPVREENGVVYFRTTKDGPLFSMPAREVDAEATKAAAAPAKKEPEPIVVTPQADDVKRRPVTAEERDRLLRELEQRHGGKPAPPEQLTLPAPPLPTKEEAAERKRVEWWWRSNARVLREAIQRAIEERDLLLDRANQLKSEISGFIALGYKPKQFTYQTTQLQHVLDALPYAELEIKRAERAWQTFREDARKEDVPPGWLRD